jgi:hypothetical protein
MDRSIVFTYLFINITSLFYFLIYTLHHLADTGPMMAGSAQAIAEDKNKGIQRQRILGEMDITQTIPKN